MFADGSLTDLKNDNVERLVSSSWNNGVWRIRRKRLSTDPGRKNMTKRITVDTRHIQIQKMLLI